MKDTFLTIESESEGFFKDKGSKFLAYAFPVIDEEDIKGHIDVLKKKYYDARHHCYAYVLGNEGEQYRANDDGEPNHSAGDPILGQIRSKDLTNVLVVVVRYFGGTKLGVPGLINAYKTSTAEALNLAQIIEKQITESITIRFGYPMMNDVMRIVKNYDLNITHQNMELTCEMTLEIRQKLLEEVIDKINLLQGVDLIH